MGSQSISTTGSNIAGASGVNEVPITNRVRFQNSRQGGLVARASAVAGREKVAVLAVGLGVVAPQQKAVVVPGSAS